MAAIIVSNGNRGLLSDNRVSIPVIKGLPVPNCQENVDWWIMKAEEDIDFVLIQLKNLERVGVAWTGWLLKRIIKEVC